MLFNVVAALPVTILIFLFPDQIVTVLWGETWLGVVPFLKIMAAMTLLLPMFSLLKARFLGQRRNLVITVVYLVGAIIFVLGLLMLPQPASSLWVAGLATGSYVVMVSALWISLERSCRSEP